MNADDVLRFSRKAAEVAEALWPGHVEIGGVEYPAAVGNPPLEGMIVTGGEVLSGDLIVRVRKDELVEPPARETRMKVWVFRGSERKPLGKTWVIRRVTGYGAGDAGWTLNCEPHN